MNAEESRGVVAHPGGLHHRRPSPREPYWGRSGVDGSHGLANHRINLAGRRDVKYRSRQSSDATVAGLASDVLRDTRVLVVDDLASYREHLADVISEHGAVFTGVAWDLSSLVSAFEDILPRVILINVATRNSAELLRHGLTIGPNVRVIATGVAEDDESTILACAEAGVFGYHLRGDSLRDLLRLIRRVADGEFLCPPQVSAVLARRMSALATTGPAAPKELVLTTREAQILGLLEIGLSNRDIAERLHIAVHTVKNHVHSLLGKLGVGSRAQAAALARSLRHRDGGSKELVPELPEKSSGWSMYSRVSDGQGFPMQRGQNHSSRSPSSPKRGAVTLPAVGEGR